MYWIEARGVGDGVSGDMLAPELAQSSSNMTFVVLIFHLMANFWGAVVVERDVCVLSGSGYIVCLCEYQYWNPPN